MRYFVPVLFVLALTGSLLRAGNVTLSAFDSSGPVAAGSVQINGQPTPAWQTSPQNPVLSFHQDGTALAPASGALYLGVTYLDQGYGRLNVTGKTSDGQEIKPDKFTQVVLTDSGKWVTSYERLNSLPDAGLSEVDLRVSGPNSDHPLAISKVVLQDAPFPDAHFQYILADAWMGPYAGPTTPGIDNSTLKGKVMVGYQGWFRTPNDPSDRGWVHWGDMTRGQFNTDMWPDTSAYPASALDKADDVKTLSGKPGYLFSSAWPEVAKVHFQWMKENNIDGAFVQRFLGDTYPAGGHPEWVLDNVRSAANQEGRIWAVEYDVSGAKDDEVLGILKKDWIWLNDHFGIKKDPAYARQNGKLVVFIWGLPFPDRRFTPATANAVVDFFKNDPTYGGNYVIGGIPAGWQKMDADWQAHFKTYDGALTWMPGGYADDVAGFKAIGVDYYPHVHPGFSWANLKHLPSGSTEQSTPRDGGRTYEKKFAAAATAGADRLFVGMFDEYDEGTAIIPMSDDPPPTPSRPGTVLKFFVNPQMQEHAIEQHKDRVGLIFDGTSPAKEISGQHFFMRWEGQIVPTQSGDYSLRVAGPAGDKWSLWINEKEVRPPDGQPEGSTPNIIAHVTMTAGQPVIYRIDYTHATMNGEMKFLWTGPSLNEEEIPTSCFIDAWGRFLTNEGNPPDLYLKLTSAAKDMITGKRAPTDLPVPLQ
jgi:PA14 domain